MYADGGVIGKNPSEVGGTFAFCYVTENGGRLTGIGGHVTPDEIGLPRVTNNVTEFLALLLALEQLPDGWAGPVYTDSEITSCRFSKGRRSKFNGVPDALRDRLFAVMDRLGQYVVGLLAGHPNKRELAAGRRADGMPVSLFNVWCDKRCAVAAEEFRAARVKAAAGVAS